MEKVNSYINHILRHKWNSKVEREYKKPHVHMHYRNGDLYYNFSMNDINFNKLNESLRANLFLYKIDLLEELKETEDLYDYNVEGIVKISKF